MASDPDKQLLYKYLDACDAAQQRAEEADKLADFLTRPHQEFDPWDFNHFGEALHNCEPGEERVIWACMVEAVNKNLEDNSLNRMSLHSLRRIVENYWHRIALTEAVKRVNS